MKIALKPICLLILLAAAPKNMNKIFRPINFGIISVAVVNVRVGELIRQYAVANTAPRTIASRKSVLMIRHKKGVRAKNDTNHNSGNNYDIDSNRAELPAYKKLTRTFSINRYTSTNYNSNCGPLLFSA